MKYFLLAIWLLAISATSFSALAETKSSCYTEVESGAVVKLFQENPEMRSAIKHDAGQEAIYAETCRQYEALEPSDEPQAIDYEIMSRLIDKVSDLTLKEWEILALIAERHDTGHLRVYAAAVAKLRGVKK